MDPCTEGARVLLLVAAFLFLTSGVALACSVAIAMRYYRRKKREADVLFALAKFECRRAHAELAAVMRWGTG